MASLLRVLSGNYLRRIVDILILLVAWTYLERSWIWNTYNVALESQSQHVELEKQMSKVEVRRVAHGVDSCCPRPLDELNYVPTYIAADIPTAHQNEVLHKSICLIRLNYICNLIYIWKKIEKQKCKDLH